MKRQSSSSSASLSSSPPCNYTRSSSRSIPLGSSPLGRRSSSGRSFPFEDEKIRDEGHMSNSGRLSGSEHTSRESPRRSLSRSYDLSSSPGSFRASSSNLRPSPSGVADRYSTSNPMATTSSSTPRRSSVTENPVLSSSPSSTYAKQEANRQSMSMRSLGLNLPTLPKNQSPSSSLSSSMYSSSAPLSSPSTLLERRPILATEAMTISGGSDTARRRSSSFGRTESPGSARQRYERAGGLALDESLSSLLSSSRRLHRSSIDDGQQRRLSDGPVMLSPAAAAADAAVEEGSLALTTRSRRSGCGQYSPGSSATSSRSSSASSCSSGRPPQQPSKIISQSSPRLITAIGAICRPSPRVSLSSPTALKRQLVGLTNLGNTCFLNSVLQCLLSTEPLVRFFAESRHRSCLCSESPMRGQLASAFADLASQICSMTHHAIANPAALKRVVGKWAPHFSGYEQQDSQEFLRFLLDGLSEDLNRATPTQREKAKRLTLQANSSPDVSLLTPDPVTLASMADAAWDRFLWHNNSVITDLFCGQLQSSKQCLSCGRWTFCHDPFMDLSVNIPKDAEVMEKRRSILGRSGLGSRGGGQSATLEDCLKAFTDDEVMDGDEKASCDYCKTRSKCIKRLRIHRFPPILVLHIKRFRYNEYTREKLTTTIRFPLTGLDLEKYGTANFECITTTKPPVYDLYAISNHMGGLGGGHYTAHCLCNGDGRSGSSSSSSSIYRRSLGGYGSSSSSSSSADTPDWHLFDDSSVSKAGSASLSGQNAYVLFYKQRIKD